MKDIYYAVAHRDQMHIDSFKKRYDSFDDSLIPDIFRQELSETVTDWKKSNSWGSSHVIYFVKTKGRGERLVFRANTGYGEPEIVMLTEKLVTDALLEKGIPTNRILAVDVSREKYPFDYQIQEDLGGSDPEVDFPDGQTAYDQLSFELGQYIARLADFTYPQFGRFSDQASLEGKLVGTKSNFYDYMVLCLDDDLRHLVNAEFLRSKQAEQVIKIFDDHKSLINTVKGSLVHHDLADHNLRYHKGHLKAVFDWEAMVVGESALDLASCPTWSTLYPREEKILEGYQSLRALPENWNAKRDIYRLRTLIWKTVYCIKMNILTKERAARLTKALEPFKIYSYLNTR